MQEKPTEKTVQGRVVKPSLWDKFKATFFSGEGNVKDYVVKDVIVPTIKRLVLDIIENGASMLIMGDAPKGHGKLGRTNYSKYSYTSSRDEEPLSRTPSPRVSGNWYDVELASRDDAVYVRSELLATLEQYQEVSVKRLKSLINEQTEYTDAYWGWKALAGSTILPSRSGVVLRLPKPIELGE